MRKIFLFAHGAGADQQSEFMLEVDKLLTAKGIEVKRFNFPYMDKRLEDGKRRPPDRAPKLIECFKQQVEAIAQTLTADDQLIIGGKSMGGRMASLLMAQYPELPIKAGAAFGFPFHAPGKDVKDRLDHFPDIKQPFLFLQGERDAMGNKEEVADYSLPAKAQLLWLEDGNHDLKPRVKSGFTQQQHLISAVSELVGLY